MEIADLLIGTGILVIVIYIVIKKVSDPKNSEPATQEVVKEKETKKKSEITYGKIKLFYGSQSGTATKFAGILEDEAQANDFQPEVLSVEDYTTLIEPNEQCVAVFLMATHGEGEPTDNAVNFIKWVKDVDRDDHSLNKMQFTVFGLGNTQYEHYNKMGRQTDKFLRKCGAKEIYVYGEGDDNSSLEDDFNDWKENLWNKLKEQIQPKKLSELESQQQQQGENDKQSTQQTEQKEIDLSCATVLEGVKYDFQTDKFLRASLATVKDIREIRQNTKDGSTLHMELDLGASGLKYKTAQNLGIFSQNSEQIVKEVASYLQVDLKQVINNPTGAKNQYFPAPLSVFNVLTHFTDFSGQLMKKTLKDLAKLTNDENVKAKFELMASAKGKEQFKTEIENNKETFFGLIKKYNIKLNLDQFLLMTPRLAPRVFTISSSNLLNNNIVHVTDSLLEDILPNGDKKVGVCSQYFTKIYEEFQKGNKQIQVRVDFRESSFKLPQDQTPVMMVGAGTGVAPFIAFAQEKQYLVEKGINIAPGQFSLYFGCKHEDGDYIFRDEIQEFQNKNIINKLYTAFSRDSDKKVYVQHRVLENADEVYELLFQNKGTLFICGSMSMGKSVIESVEKIIEQKQNISSQESIQFVKKMEEDKKIIKELW